MSSRKGENMKSKLERKVRNLTHQLEYIQKVYPGCSKVHKLKYQIYYYNKKIASLSD